MTGAWAWVWRIILMVIIGAVILPLSQWPAYTVLRPGEAIVRLSLTHSAERVEPCRELSREEMLKLPPNMRQPRQCPRERVPLYVILELDGNILYDAHVLPSGLSRDGPARVYEKFVVAAGQHEVTVRMRDTPRDSGFDHISTVAIDLAERQNLVIDFRSDEGWIFK